MVHQNFEIASVSLGYQLNHNVNQLAISPKDTLYPHLLDHFTAEFSEQAKDYSLPSWKRQVKDREKEKIKSTKSGDTIVRDMNYWFDNLGIVRHDYQVYFHQKMVETHLRKIYEKEWNVYETEILRKFNLTKLYQERVIVCPRRFGKTYSVASFGAPATYCIPNHEIAIFSTGKRAAGKMMALIITFMLVMPRFREMCTTHNVENLIIEMSDSDKRKICCYPGTVGVRLSSPPYYFLLFSLPACLPYPAAVTIQQTQKAPG